jgi:hypothetical protein
MTQARRLARLLHLGDGMCCARTAEGNYTLWRADGQPMVSGTVRTLPPVIMRDLVEMYRREARV